MFRDFVKIASCVPATKTGTPVKNSRAAAELIDVITSVEKNVDFLLFPFSTLCGVNTGNLIFNGSFADLCEKAEADLIDFIKSKNITSTVLFCTETVCPVCKKKCLKSFVISNNFVAPYTGAWIEKNNNMMIRNLCGCSNDYSGDLIYKTPKFKFCLLPVTDTDRDFAAYQRQMLACEFVFLSCAVPEQTAGFEKLLDLAKATSKLASNVIILSNASATNTTTPYLSIGAAIAVRNGEVLGVSRQNDFNEIISLHDIDVETIKLKNYSVQCGDDKYPEVELVNNNKDEPEKLYCEFLKEPFFERDLTQEQINQRLDDMINAQKFVIAGRMRALIENNSNCEKVVIGISGGLDSTAALIYAYEAVKLMKLPSENIIAVTMKGFGTSKQTRINAFDLIESVGAKLIDVPIEKSVRQHFSDIGHDENIKDIVYENAQARERMQIPLDLANKYGGFVINTGDLSEIALGFCTFGGDHFGQLAVNSCITKTMLQKVVRRYASITDNKDLSDVLFKIADTKISPELLPPDENGNISQSTEDFIGPYILHDFFLYYHLRYNFSVGKIYFYAVKAFADMFSEEEIKKYLRLFIRRFYANQFKRTCSPEGALIASINLSPFNIIFPSDLNSDEILRLLDQI